MPEIVSKSDLPPLEQIGLAAEYYPDYQNEHIRMHGIDVMLFSVVLAGRGIHYQQQESWPEESCSVTITRCGEHHSIVSLPGETMRIVNIYLDNRHFLMPALPDDLAEVITAFLPVSPTLMPREKQLTRITFSTADTMEFLALALVAELNENRPGSLQAASDYFRLFLIECGRQAVRGSLTHGGRPDAGEWRVEKLCRYLNRNYAQSHSLDELAARSGWQKNYLCHRFKEYTGSSIFDYLHDLRIRNAARLLLYSRRKTADIARCCGYADVNYFNRMFRRFTGTSPARYRRAHAPGTGGSETTG